MAKDDKLINSDEDAKAFSEMFGSIAQSILGVLLLALPLIFLIQLGYVLIIEADKTVDWLSDALSHMELRDDAGFLIFLGLLAIAGIILLKDAIGWSITFIIFLNEDDDK